MMALTLLMQQAMAALKAGGQQFDVIYDTVSSFAAEDPNYEPTMRALLNDNGTYEAINGQWKLNQ